MFPYAFPYGPYQPSTLPAPNHFGEFPATLAYAGRLYASVCNLPCAMDLPIWIERDQDGRGYYVMKKPETQSLKQIFTEVFLPLRRRDPLQQAQATTSGQPSQPSNPLQPIAQQHHYGVGQETNGLASTSSRTPTPNADQQNNVNHAPVNTVVPNQQVALRNAVQQPQYLPAQLPPQWPSYPTQHNNIAQVAASAYNQPLYFPPQHTSVFPGFPLPVHSGAQNPPIAGVNASQQSGGQFCNPHNLIATNLKHKCGVCGRSRSARYHHEHPILPGRSPAPTICGKCKKRQSHDTGNGGGDTRNQDEQRRHRQRSPWRHRAEKASRILHSRARTKGKPKKRREYTSSSDDSSTESPSSESDRTQLADRQRRTSPPNINIIKVVETARPNARSTRGKTVYVESVSTEGEYEPRYQHLHRVHYSQSETTPPRVTGPPPCAIHRGRSFPAMYTPIVDNRRDYFHDPPDTKYERYTHSTHISPQPRVRSSSFQASRPVELQTTRRVVGTAHSQEDLDDQEVTARYRSAGGYDQYDGEEDNDDVVEVHEVISRTPSPSEPVFPHSKGGHQLPKFDRREHFKDAYYPHIVDSHAVGTMDESRRRPKKPSHTKLTEDYDWYDQDGMRVRVREI